MQQKKPQKFPKDKTPEKKKRPILKPSCSRDWLKKFPNAWNDVKVMQDRIDLFFEEEYLISFNNLLIWLGMSRNKLKMVMKNPQIADVLDFARDVCDNEVMNNTLVGKHNVLASKFLLTNVSSDKYANAPTNNADVKAESVKIILPTALTSKPKQIDNKILEAKVIDDD